MYKIIYMYWLIILYVVAYIQHFFYKINMFRNVFQIAVTIHVSMEIQLVYLNKISDMLNQVAFFFASHFTFYALAEFCSNSQNAGHRILHQFMWLLHTLCTCVFSNRKQFAVSWFM